MHADAHEEPHRCALCNVLQPTCRRRGLRFLCRDCRALLARRAAEADDAPAARGER